LDVALNALGINGPFLLSQFVNFGILFLALTVLVWRPLMKALDDRREMLRQQEEDAEAVAQVRAGIDQERERLLDEAKAEADKLLAEARSTAREMEDQASAEARQEAEGLLAQARLEAEEERDRTLGQMREQIAALAVAAAYKLVGESLDDKRQRALVDEFFSGVREGKVEVLTEDVEPVEGAVVVTSAVPLTDKEQESVHKDLVSRLGEGAKVSFEVDPAILGGLMVRVGDRVIDGSLAGQLGQLRQTLA
jgi:F-type H+-transporting ATPase subunit b